MPINMVDNEAIINRSQQRELNECDMTGVIESSVKFDEPPVGTNMARELLAAFRRHAHRTLLVDSGDGREWTGAQLLQQAGRIATCLIRRLNLKPGDVVLTLCDHSVQEILLALGVILAGGSLYGCCSNDGLEEHKVICELVPPNIIATNSRLQSTVEALKDQIPVLSKVPTIWIDDSSKLASCFNTNGTYTNGHVEEAHDSNNNSNNGFSDELVDGNNNNISITDADNNNNESSLNYYEELVQSGQVCLLKEFLEKGQIDELLLDKISERLINSSEHIATYMLTSGSTGRPKIVPSTHEELIYGLYGMISASKYAINSAAQPEQKACKSLQNNGTNLLLPLSGDDVLAGDLPLDHGAGVNTMFMSLINGSKFVVMPSYDADSFWQAVHDHQITASVASTTFAYKLLCRLKALISSEKTDKWDLSRFRYITCAGSKLAFVDLIQEVNKFYKHINICQCYGATEIGFIAMLCVQDCKTHLNSVGHLFPGIYAKVVDYETGQVKREPNKRGELHIWSKSKFKGYRCQKADDPKELLARCHDEQGFYKTGDQVHFDEQQRLYIHGRIKDTLYLDQDWKILPAELEEVVDQHPLVESSAIVGIPNTNLPGCDAPKAFVKLISIDSKEFVELQESASKESVNTDLTKRLVLGDLKFIADDIYEFVAARTAEPKHLKGGVRILDEFPRVGLLNKVDRKALRRMD